MSRESIILTDSILQESKYLFKKKLTNCPKYSWCSAKESSVLSKRIDGAKRKQSIYSQKSLNCYAVGDSSLVKCHTESTDICHKTILFCYFADRHLLTLTFH